MRRRLQETPDIFDDFLPVNPDPEIRPGSPVFRFHGNGSNNSTRRVHMISLLPLSSVTIDDSDKTEKRTPIDFRIYLEAAGYLALKHFNSRNPRVIPELPRILDNCNIQMTVDMRDTRFASSTAVRELQDVFAKYPENSIERPLPFALLGAARSAVSQTISILGGVYEFPQISATSTSATLDNKNRSPYFTRTVPSNDGDARAIAMYWEHLQVPYFGAIYVRDSFGTAYFDALSRECKLRGIGVVAAPYDDGDKASITDAVQRLERAGVKYVVGIFNPRTWKTVIRESINLGIIGQPGYTWLLTEASLELTQNDFRLNRDTEGDIAQALHGIGIALLDVPSNKDLDAALLEFESDEQLQDEFVAHHSEPFIFDDFSWRFPGATLYQYLNYDAVMSLGIAACAAPQEFFTGLEMHESLLQTEFEGVTGFVSFEPTTGTRKPENLKYRIENVLLSDEMSNDDAIGFKSEISSQVDVRSNPPVEELKPYIYFDNSTVPPMALPEIDSNLNLMSGATMGIGYIFGGLAMMTAIGWLVWTIIYRKSDVVRISQPIFLGQLCFGAFVLASSIIPMGFQDPMSQTSLDAACMATPWLLSLGFVTAFSALFSKTWRLNKLFGHGQGFRRIEVKARDVMLPFIVLATSNISLLIMWSVAAPLRWTRVGLANFDSYGRSVESYGTCTSGDGKTQNAIETTAFVGIVMVNLVALLVANYQCYKARNLPTDFNESFYITLSNASMLEALVLGGPILLVVKEDPASNFLVRAILVTIVCFTVLLPVFVPKYLQRNIRKKRRAAGYQSRVVVSAFSSAPNTDRSLRRGSSGGVGFDEPDPNKPVKKGSSGIVRNNDYYFQRLSVTNSTEIRSGRTRQSFSTSSLVAGSNTGSTTLSHSFNNSSDLAKAFDNSNGSLRLSSLPVHQSSAGSLLNRSAPLIPSRVSEEHSDLLDQENGSEHSAAKAPSIVMASEHNVQGADEQS